MQRSLDVTANMASVSKQNDRVVILLTDECVYHKLPQSRQFFVVKDGKSFEDLEKEFACTEASNVTAELSPSESGPWTVLDNTDDMYKLKSIKFVAQ